MGLNARILRRLAILKDITLFTSYSQSRCCIMTSALKSSSSHPFFRHCEKPTVSPTTGQVLFGELPTWLKGCLIRNGPGIQKVGETRYSHLFDGLAILHKFEIKDGQAYYQSRPIESEAHAKNMAANRIVVSEFGTTAFPDPCESLLGKFQAAFTFKDRSQMEMTDNTSVNVAFYGDQLYAMTETVFVRRINPEDLKCVGDKTKIRDYCALNSATAHPHVFPDGTVLNVGNNWRHRKGPHYCFVKVPPAFNTDETAFKKAQIVAEIPSRWKFNPAYFHSFGMTATNKVVFIEQPLCLNVPSMVTSPLTHASYEECLKWYPNEKTRIHIVSMEDGKPNPITFETDAFFTFHHINAYETEDGFIIVDVAAYEDAEFVKNVTYDRINKTELTLEGACGRRYILPLNVEGSNGDDLLQNCEVRNKNAPSAKAMVRKGTKIVDLTPHPFTPFWIELPRINYKYNGMKYQFAYALASSERPGNHEFPILPIPDKVVKVNVDTGKTIEYQGEDNFHMLSEPVFVPSPSGKEEDDGVVLTTAMHRDDESQVDLLILDAKDLKALCAVNFKAEGAVTATFHGIWSNNK